MEYFYSKYTGEELEERLDRIDDIPELLAEMLTGKNYTTPEDALCIVKKYVPTIYENIPIDNNTIYWANTNDGKVLKARIKSSDNTGDADGDNGGCLWEKKADTNGKEYLYSKLPVVTSEGITMYADNGDLDIPSIYTGLPIDGKTLIRDEEGVLMINPNIDLGGASTWNELEGKPTWITTNKPKWDYNSDISNTPDLSIYATYNYVDDTFIPIEGDTDVLGMKNFKKGLKIDGLPITKSQDDVIYLDANLVVRGGITMYSDNTVDVGTIFDALPIDGNTIFWENGVLKANVTEGVITNITSDMVVEALGFTPYNASNPNGYISGITSAMVVSALGFTPLQSHQTIYALTIQKNGTNIDTYTPNSAKKTINIVVPTKVSELDNDEEYATTSDLDSRIDALINGAPTAFDTLKEIADVLQGNVNSIGDIITTLGTKADKAVKISAGTGLSGGGTLEADRTLSLATSGVTAGTYKSVDVDKYGRVTSGTNPTTLEGYGITDAYTKTKVDEMLGNYVTLATKQPITGEKNFTGGLKVNGSPIVYDATNKYWKLEGDLLVTGGVTMYASDSSFTPSTIMDAIATDGVNLKVVDGVLTFVGSSGGGLTEVYWDDVIGKPTLLSSFIDDVGYLKTSGGQMTGNIGYTLSPDSYAIGLPTAGSIEGLTGIDKVSSYKSFIGSVYTDDWYHVLSIRHRNGNDDGNKFGLLLYTTLTANGNLEWNRQYNGTWQGHRVILDSVNWSQYVTAADGGSYLPLSGGSLSNSVNSQVLNVSSTVTSSGWLSPITAYSPNLQSGGHANILVGKESSTRNLAWIGFKYIASGSYDNLLTMGLYGVDDVLVINGNGYVGINNISPEYQLHIISDYHQVARFQSNTQSETSIAFKNKTGLSFVSGMMNSSYFVWSEQTNMYVIQIDSSGNGLFSGGVTMYSDIRKKTKLKDVELTLQQIADAPLIQHYYNSDEKRTTHVGSIAQYWASMNDWFCKLDGEGYYTMEIQNAALASAISIARELVKYESKTDRKIRLLKQRVKELEDKIEKLENN